MPEALLNDLHVKALGNEQRGEVVPEVMEAEPLRQVFDRGPRFPEIVLHTVRQRWALICLDLGIDTSTITGAAMAQVTCAFAEMERKRIGERTRDGMAKIKATTGKHMGRRISLPSATVERVLNERAAGLSMARIADDLNPDGVATGAGGNWYASTIRQVLGSSQARELAGA